MKTIETHDQPRSRDDLLAKRQPTVQYRIVQLHFV